MADDKKPKIYFAGSISGGRDHQSKYAKIVEILKVHGTVLTEHVADPKLKSDGNDGDVNV